VNAFPTSKHPDVALRPPSVAIAAALLSFAGLAHPGIAAAQAMPALEDGTEEAEPSSTEQGRTHLHESFAPSRRERIREQRRQAFEDTRFDVHVRSFYLDRNKLDDTQSEAWTLGGWAGFKTGYFRDWFALAATGYASLPLYAPDDKDGTTLLAPGQEHYEVVGELYADIRITDAIHVNLGRKAYDTPYINRNDIRMTPNTFDAYTVAGLVGGTGGKPEWRFGAGYFDKIKERNSEDFVSMSEDAGAVGVDRGVYAAGANYKAGNFSIGAIDYYSDDIINIAYTEARYALPLSDEWRLQLAGQYSRQQSTGDDLLTGDDFSTRQFGLKGELVCGAALFTLAYTDTGSGDNMRNPWSGYPGYTSVQVEDFNRAGEDAFILRAAYSFPNAPGLSVYGLWVNGDDPDADGTFSKDEYDFNLQWAAPPDGPFAGLQLRARYARVSENSPGDPELGDLRLILYYDPPGL
jgi:hypothetical protein